MLPRIALAVSSQQEIEYIRHHDTLLGTETSVRPRYRFSVVQTVDANSEEIYRFAIQRANYPDAQDGKGWGEPRYGDKYNEQRFASFADLQSHLTDLGINNDRWEPVESE